MEGTVSSSPIRRGDPAAPSSNQKRPRLAASCPQSPQQSKRVEGNGGGKRGVGGGRAEGERQALTFVNIYTFAIVSVSMESRKMK